MWYTCLAIEDFRRLIEAFSVWSPAILLTNSSVSRFITGVHTTPLPSAATARCVHAVFRSVVADSSYCNVRSFTPNGAFPKNVIIIFFATCDLSNTSLTRPQHPRSDRSTSSVHCSQWKTRRGRRELCDNDTAVVDLLIARLYATILLGTFKDYYTCLSFTGNSTLNSTQQQHRVWTTIAPISWLHVSMKPLGTATRNPRFGICDIQRGPKK